MQALSVLLAAIAGWLAGYVSERATEMLGGMRPMGLPRWSPALLLRDPVVQVAAALAWAGLMVALGPTPRWLAASLVTVPLIQVAATDLRTRDVFLPIATAGVLFGVAAAPVLEPRAPAAGLLGAVIGAVVFGVLYLLGMLFSRLRYGGEEAMAMGDVWIAAMVGAISGSEVVTALVAGTLIGAVPAAVLMLTRRSRLTTMPYGPGLCIGGLIGLGLVLAR